MQLFSSLSLSHIQPLLQAGIPHQQKIQSLQPAFQSPLLLLNSGTLYSLKLLISSVIAISMSRSFFTKRPICTQFLMFGLGSSSHTEIVISAAAFWSRPSSNNFLTEIS